MSFPKPSPAESCVKILVVDDHPGTAKTLARAIARLVTWVDVIPVTNGNEALRQAMGNTIDILITDMNMPGMTGLELVEQLRNRPFGQPTFCFLVTASETPGLKVASNLLRINEVFFKPCHPERICQAIAKAIEVINQTKSAYPKLVRNNNMSIDIEIRS